MATFTYKGADKEGKQVTQTVEADDRFLVYEIAHKNGHTIDSIEEARRFDIGRLLHLDDLLLFINRIKLDEMVMLTRNLGAMLKAGLPLSRALSVAERQTKNPKLKMVLKTLGERLNSGKAFHEALAEFPNVFSRLYVAMIHAGEEGGKLAESLEILAMQMERTSTLKKKIKGAMVYPVIVISIMVVIGILMMIYVIPTLTATFKELNVELPTATKVIIFVSDALSQHTALSIGALMAFAVLGSAAFRTKAGRTSFEWALIHAPIIGTITKEVNAARTARTLSSLLSSGVDVVGALSITNDVVQNSFYNKVLKDAAVRVEKGEPLSGPFTERPDLYPLLVGEMIAVGEETGQISGMLLQLAIFYENEVEQKTKDLSTIIEPLLMVVIGGMVGFFAMAMISPIYSISDSIG
jgi:type IV pilus assembly protein PilC